MPVIVLPERRALSSLGVIRPGAANGSAEVPAPGATGTTGTAATGGVATAAGGAAVTTGTWVTTGAVGTTGVPGGTAAVDWGTGSGEAQPTSATTAAARSARVRKAVMMDLAWNVRFSEHCRRSAVPPEQIAEAPDARGLAAGN